ncbi:cell-cycle control medial ring component [Sordaria brevicollis]|uniref:Cell-cycle control medial ring component n=1 Tax=Sordaria brevicollis TaxID=83679 RepID=A0AAE0PBY4_SORBR|nr:cell-cycle control medial ring component [Sordaria brevicollis]
MATEVAFAKTFLAVLDTKPTKISPDHVEDARTYPASTPFTLPHHPTIRPFRKPSSRAAAPGSTPASASTTTTGVSTPSDSGPTVLVHIRSPRNPSLSLTLPQPQPLATTSILDIKSFVSSETGMPIEKLKVLYNKKPAGDVKSLKEVLGGATPEGGELELSLMVMGGQATYDSAEAAEKRAARDAAKAQAGGADGGEKKVEVPEVEMKDTETTAGGEQAGPVAQGLSGAAVLDTEEFWEDLKGYLQQRIRDVEAAEEVVGRFRGAWSQKS